MLERKEKLIKKRKDDSYYSLKECYYCKYFGSNEYFDKKSTEQRNKILELKFYFTAAPFSLMKTLISSISNSHCCQLTELLFLSYTCSCDKKSANFWLIDILNIIGTKIYLYFSFRWFHNALGKLDRAFWVLKFTMPLRNYFIKYPLPLKIYVIICKKIVDPLPPLGVTKFLDGPYDDVS